MPDETLTVHDLLAHLDGDVATGRRKQIIQAFADAAQPLYALTTQTGGAHKGDGELAFALYYLASRSLTDLVAAVHLASHAYVQQAYTLIRPPHECCDLMELFAQTPEDAGKWANVDKPGVEYGPRKVRERIGSSRSDADVYGHLSEMGPHPRFAGSRAAGAMRVNVDDPRQRQIILRLGSMWESHPSAVFVYMFAFEALIRVGFKLRHLDAVSERATAEAWMVAFLTCARFVAEGLKLIRRELADMDVIEHTEFLDSAYDDLILDLQRDIEPPEPPPIRI